MGRLTKRVNNNNGGGVGGEEIRPAAAMKKGPWTAAEDAKLSEYVRKHGDGNWNAVQQNTGLARCGKSCRLRWANHLRPNLKKGAFSPEEERLIIRLHAKYGNKWARMASLLPGRTDNEIKNFWNTRTKRHQRAGLPLYPNEVVQTPQLYYNSFSSLSSFSSLITNNIINKPMNHEPTNNNLSSLPITNPQSVSHHDHLSNLMPFNHLSTQTNNNIIINPYTFHYYTTTTTTKNNSTMAALGPLIISSMIAGPPELPSSQTPATSDSHMASAGDSNDPCFDRFAIRSGLLGDLVAAGDVNTTTMMLSEELEGVVRSKLTFENMNEETENLISSCEQSSIGIEQRKGPLDATSMDDDLMSLLNNFQSSAMPDSPEWYSGRPDLTIGGFSPCSWNNMPGIH